MTCFLPLYEVSTACPFAISALSSAAFSYNFSQKFRSISSSLSTKDKYSPFAKNNPLFLALDSP
jgi:hypothetical protein